MDRFLALALCVFMVNCSHVDSSTFDQNANVRILGNLGVYGTSGKPAEVKPASLGGPTESIANAYVQYGASPSTNVGGIDEKPFAVESGGEKVTLNFVNADLQDFARSVFDEILHEPVIIDPALSGKITVRTGQPVDRVAAVELTRQMMEMNGAQLSREGKVWRVVARAPGAGMGRSMGNAKLIALRFIDPEEARAALQGLSNGAVTVTSVPGARALLLSGQEADVEPLQQLVSTLDVDRMRSQSFALLPLREASAVAVAKDLLQVFASAKTMQIIPVQRMNALLIITGNARQLEEARRWALRLDRQSQANGRAFVYPVQNRRATDLATVLKGMFATEGSSPSQTGQGGNVSPAFPIQKTDAADSTQQGGTPQNPEQILAAAFRDMEGGPRGAEQRVAIQADVATNSLVVTASPEQWRMISAAISRLDVQPTQVLIEATIAEVQLNDQLRHGVRWFFESGNHSVALSDLETGAVAPTFPGASYSFSVPSAKVVLSALEAVTNVEVVSSPALTVLDNQTATLKVGDQVPIATRSAQGVTNPDAPVVNDITLKDTGVILSVTPRVNASGLVQLDISQEVSDVVKTTTSSIDSPTIRQRKIDSTVAVGSGTEIVLGGLIGVRREKGDSGVPFLKDIPLLGNAFKSDASNIRDRSELLIILRPTVMGSRMDIEAVTQAVRAGMAGANRAMGARQGG